STAADGKGFPIAELKDYMPRLVKLVELVGEGRIDDFLELTETELGREFRTTDGPFGVDERVEYGRQLDPFRLKPPRFESVDFVGVRRVSSQAYAVVLVGNSVGGPIHFQFRVYRYQNEWRMLGVDWFTDWREVNYAAFDEPVTYRLSPSPLSRKPAATTTE
ncbi:MAG: hypothetical protein ACREIV_01175, partial [Planctomycetaceae bacterium]